VSTLAASAELERGMAAETLEMDLRGLEFMDSTGLHFVLDADARTRARGGRMVVVRGSETVHRIFRLAQLEERLEFVVDPEELDAPQRSDA